MIKKPYTRAEITFIKQHVGNITKVEIARRLGRTTQSVYSICKHLRRLGWDDPTYSGRNTWTPADDEYIISVWNRSESYQSKIQSIRRFTGHSLESIKAHIQFMRRKGISLRPMTGCASTRGKWKRYEPYIVDCYKRGFRKPKQISHELNIPSWVVRYIAKSNHLYHPAYLKRHDISGDYRQAQ